MRGVIVALAPDETYGQLLADDGERYSYWASEVRNGPARIGHSVEFQMWEGQPIDMVVLGRPTAPRAAAPSPAAAGSFPPSDYWTTLFTSPRGRISRRQFWLHGVLPIVAASVLIGWIPVLGQIFSLALLWASICIAFKRFHDLGYPGWWSLLYLVPLFGAMVFAALGYFVPGIMEVGLLLAKILAGLGLLIGIAQIALVYARAGQHGPNRYGSDPLIGT